MNKVLAQMQHLYPSTLDMKEKVKRLKMWRAQAEERKELYPWYTTAAEVLSWVKKEFYKLAREY